MAEFKVNDQVININTNNIGIINEVYPHKRGSQKYKVFYSSDNIKDEDEREIEKYVKITDLFDLCKIGKYMGYPDFQVYNTTFKIKNSSNNTLSSIKASKTLFKTYQYIPLMKFLNSETRTLLIADEVGLGKTIETGHIMLELKARYELKNVLVICPSSLANKWQEELIERFGLDFSIYDKTDNLIEDLRTHNGKARGIITYEKVRQEKIKNGEKEKVNPLLDFLENNSKKFSLIVCDEAHRLRNNNTKQYKAIEKLLTHTETALFLTATPIMLGRENLFQLLHLLNSQRYNDEKVFLDETKHNEPFVWAVNSLNSNVALDDIKNGLEEKIDANDYVRELPMFKPLMEKFEQEESPKLKAAIQRDLYDINPLSSIMTRTRKVDVTADLSQAQRVPIPLEIELSTAENKLISQYMDDLKNIDPLARSTKSQQIASSIFAYKNYEDFANNEVYDSKFNKLIEILNECSAKGNGKAIVFVGYKNTQHYIATRLKNKGIKYRLINGDDRKDRTTAVEEFRDLNDVKVLLSTEVGSEGLDMQFCDTIVNYDLPWNPMVVEQRIGRIDRIGQQSKIIHIYSLLVKGSVQEKIYGRLMDRIEEFRRTIGDLEPILSQEFKFNDDTNKEIKTIGKAIESLYRTELTKEEIERKMMQIEQAIENNLRDSKKLEKELSESFNNDSYLRAHLNTIIRNKAYVTESELENYVKKLFREELPTCSIEKTNDDIFTISVPQSDKKVITNFLGQYYTKFKGDDQFLINDYINKICDRSSFKVTFSQEIAEKNRNITYLNIYHPFILVAKEYFGNKLESNSQVFRFQIPKNELGVDNIKIFDGNYMLAIYDITTEKNRYGIKRESHEMYPVLYDIDNQNLIDDDDITESFYRAIQDSGILWNQKENLKWTDDIILDMRTDFNDKIRLYCNEHRENITIKQQNDIEQQKKSIEIKYNKQIEDEQSRIHDFERIINTCNSEIEKGNGEDKFLLRDDYEISYVDLKKRLVDILPARRGKLKSIEDEYEEKIKSLSNIDNPIVDNKLIMLNLINIS